MNKKVKHTLRRITTLPERTEPYSKSGCSGPGCNGKVRYIASYPQAGVRADRLYCADHAERFARRYGIKWKGGSHGK